MSSSRHSRKTCVLQTFTLKQSKLNFTTTPNRHNQLSSFNLVLILHFIHNSNTSQRQHSLISTNLNLLQYVSVPPRIHSSFILTIVSTHFEFGPNRLLTKTWGSNSEVTSRSTWTERDNWRRGHHISCGCASTVASRQGCK